MRPSTILLLGIVAGLVLIALVPFVILKLVGIVLVLGGIYVAYQMHNAGR